jgi:DNA-binding MarR family transcriptional regulator
MIQEPVSDLLLEQTIDHFWDTIPPVWGRIKDNVRRIAMENFNLTVEQFHILRLIRRGSHSVSELAEAQLISRSAISQAVDGLVGRGLISRQQQVDDRRYVRLDLTDSGNELLNAIFEKNRVWMKQLMSGATPDDLLLLQGGLDALRKICRVSGEMDKNTG